MTDIPNGFQPLFRTSPFLDVLGPFFYRPSGTSFVIGLRWRRSMPMRGTVHGGLLLTLADVALGYTAAFSEEPALSLTTANIPADFAGHAGLLDDGSVDHFWPEDKATWLEELMRRMGFRRDEAVAVGDSFLDVPMFGVVGQAIYVGSTVPLGVHAIHVPDGDIYQIARGIVGGPRA